ncbi:S8 family serine peptidase [Terrimonas sp. NA20]|uniref:S8 family serine peptidase n=1 Tax=Terrimonas ginsenosidimutans TaxID=2908004 RepID=A0ABS9KZU3_9BACT|nr:S8 family serine peptidase [Terrimonas ginsenosidimutans]MCG2617861.1 S8 family serine peptidase [Terrimonas ginsenosidimutans]
MRFFSVRLLIIVMATGCCGHAFAQVKTNTEVLRQKAVQEAAREKVLHEEVIKLAKQKNWDTLRILPNGGISKLVGVDGFGLPLYVSTHSNLAAAATIGTNKLWPGGTTGLNLSGSSANVKGKLAVWDGGRVRETHVELVGRVTQKDNATTLSEHATHVAGTLTATGVNPNAKGMSFGLQELLAYDFTSDNSEMTTAAPNLLVSNHSYGFNAGWNYNTNVTPNRWEFLGRFDATEDYRFGYYSNDAATWDEISYNAPFYLIVKSAGNNRNENGPAVGQPYWRYNASGVMEAAGNRPAGISSNNSYEILSTNSTAKNILLIGAVNAIPTGYSRAEDVVMSNFSSWGPTDDGRIKPDVVANGVNLLSSISASNTSYGVSSGTSMSSPNASGSLLLLQEYYAQKNSGNFMRAATLKGIVIHTADEAGTSPGPDYQFGWGLINMQRAADMITNNNNGTLIREEVLANGGKLTLPVVASGDGVLRATISWTDPKGTVEPIANALNNPNRKLINDLDIVIKRGATEYRPWILTPAVPAAAATRGDNILDNVEKIELPDVIPGETYTIEITHKGTLQAASQAYSLLVSGITAQSYCASNPTSTAGARIDSVSFSTIRRQNPAGCTGYTNNTSILGTVEASQVLPIFVRLNSCDATSTDKVVKVFIDANNDGDFTDANETLATSGVINGNGDFTGSITIPSSMTVGRYSILRIVMQETNNAAGVTPCGTYTRGETQDYRILVVTPSLDFGISELVSPEQGNCAATAQYVSVRIRNNGSANKKDIPLTAVVRQGTTTVATLTATYADTILAFTDEIYTFQTPVEIAPGLPYTVTVTTAFPGDQNPANDQTVFSFTSRAKAAAPAGTAVICGTTAQLNVTAANNSVAYSWYTTASATTPLVTGAMANTSTIQPTYYLSSGEISKLGPVNKQAFTDGGYNAFSGNIVKFTTSAPVTMQTARLYIGTPGKITFTLRQVTTENADGSYSYYAISSKTIDVTATAPTPPVLGASNNNPADAGAVYYLGIDFPTPANYYLLITCSDGASIYRSNNITSTTHYPYTVPGVISITGNTATDPAGVDQNYFQKFYYFYYDIGLKLPYCASDRAAIVATTPTAPVITQNGNVLTSSVATGNQWYLNGFAVSGATEQTFTPTTNGIYTVAISSGACILTSNQINFTTTAVVNVDPDEIGMKVSPNPAPAGRFTLQLNTNTRSNLDISLLNMTGQQVYKEQIPNFSGRLSKQIEPARLSAGVYYLRVIHDKKSYIRKVVVLE